MYLCLGEAACWVCSAFDARVQNYDAAALESCPTSPTSHLQQGSGCFWHLQFSMLYVGNPNTTGWHLPKQAVLLDLRHLGPCVRRVSIYPTVLQADLLVQKTDRQSSWDRNKAG